MSTVAERAGNQLAVDPKADIGGSPPSNKRQRSVSLESSKLVEQAGPQSRKEVLSLVGKELASSLGSRILLAMLAESKISMRELSRKSGFDVSLLSNIAKGKRVSGPELWTLVALAEAMDLDLKVSFSKR